jgi:type I restriction enzyme R subunit
MVSKKALFILKKRVSLGWFYETYENEYIEITEYQLQKMIKKVSFGQTKC